MREAAPRPGRHRAASSRRRRLHQAVRPLPQSPHQAARPIPLAPERCQQPPIKRVLRQLRRKVRRRNCSGSRAAACTKPAPRRGVIQVDVCLGAGLSSRGHRRAMLAANIIALNFQDLHRCRTHGVCQRCHSTSAASAVSDEYSFSRAASGAKRCRSRSPSWWISWAIRSARSSQRSATTSISRAGT